MDKIKVYDFIENIEMFYAFLKYSKAQFFEKYPYLTQEEYDLTLSVFNKDPVNIFLIGYNLHLTRNSWSEPSSLHLHLVLFLYLPC